MVAGNGTSRNGTNGSKVIYSVLGLVAIISGLSATILPMRQEIESLREDVRQLREGEARLIVKDTESANNRAAFSERFREVETKFANAEMRVAALEDWKVWLDRNVPVVNAGHAIRIQMLEKRVYNEKEAP